MYSKSADRIIRNKQITSHRIELFLKLDRKAEKNGLNTVSSPLCSEKSVAYIAVVDAPTVMIGMLQINHRTFTHTKFVNNVKTFLNEESLFHIVLNFKHLR